MSSPSRPWFKTLSSIGLALVCLGAIGALQVPQLNRLRDRGAALSADELAQEMETERSRLELLQKIPTFGFDNLLADWVFLQFLQYFGDDEVRAATSYDLSPDYFEAILNRDPRFQQSYLFLSTSTSIYAGMPERAVTLMGQGLETLSILPPPRYYGCMAQVKLLQAMGRRQANPGFLCSSTQLRRIETNGWDRSSHFLAWDYGGDSPRYYYIWRYKGTDELLFLGEADSPEETLEQAQDSFQTTAQWADLYATVYNDAESRSVAQVSRSTVDFLASKPDLTTAQISAWGMVAVNAAQNADARTVERAMQRIRLLGGDARLRVQAWTVVFNNAATEDIRDLALDKIRDLGGRVVEDPERGVMIFPPQEDPPEASPETTDVKDE